jgi:hypothetical protein
MAMFEIVDQFEAAGFTYLHRVHNTTGKDVYTTVPTDGSMNPRQIDAKEYKAIKQAEHLGKNKVEILPTAHAIARRVLLPQNSPSVVSYYSYEFFYEHISKLCEEHDIAYTMLPKMQGGLAYVEKREIVIPMPVTPYLFMVCLHEIGHVVLNASYKAMTVLEAEYAAETWALRKGLDFELDLDDLLTYREQAKRYLRYVLFRQARLKAYKPEKVPKEYAEFAEVNPSRLVGAKVLYDRHTDELVIHQPQDCEDRFVVREDFGNVIKHTCLACTRQWYTFKP